MAATDLSKTFDDLESGEDYSGFETSVPTDLTLSPEKSDHEGKRDRKSKITKQLIERKQIMHDLQLARIELSQKNLQIENMKAEYLQKVDELEEKLHDEMHQKQILQARLESQLTIQQEESKRRQELIKNELEDVRQKQRHLEATNERLYAYFFFFCTTHYLPCAPLYLLKIVGINRTNEAILKKIVCLLSPDP